MTGLAWSRCTSPRLRLRRWPGTKGGDGDGRRRGECRESGDGAMVVWGKMDGVSGTDRKVRRKRKDKEGAPRSGGGRLMNLGGSARQSASPNQFSQKKKVHGPTCGGRHPHHPKHPSHGALSTTGTGVRCGCGWGQLRRLHNKRMPGGSRPVRCQAVLAPFWKVERRKWGRSGTKKACSPPAASGAASGAAVERPQKCSRFVHQFPERRPDDQPHADPRLVVAALVACLGAWLVCFQKNAELLFPTLHWPADSSLPISCLIG